MFCWFVHCQVKKQVSDYHSCYLNYVAAPKNVVLGTSQITFYSPKPNCTYNWCLASVIFDACLHIYCCYKTLFYLQFFLKKITCSTQSTTDFIFFPDNRLPLYLYHFFRHKKPVWGNSRLGYLKVRNPRFLCFVLLAKKKDNKKEH